MGRDTKLKEILVAAAANGAGVSINVADWRNVVFSLDTAGTTTATIKFQGSISETLPDFDAVQSASNQWEYINVIDLEDGASIDGDVGIALAATDDHRMLEANINGLRWVNAIVSGYSAGTIDVKARIFSNQ